MIVCLMGPTASGKTALALELVKRFPFEIISVDSAMVYKGMDIGTAKPTAEELREAPHHLIDIAEPAETYSAGQFCQDVHRCIQHILTQGRIPLLVGGTMLYFKALQFGLSPLPGADPAVRARLCAEAESVGWPALHQRLSQIDPVAAQRIHPQDAQRIQRALEICEKTGMSMTTFCAQSAPTQHDNPIINFGLMVKDRAELGQRIAVRFRNMLKQGFIEEVARLKMKPGIHADLPAMRAVGYRQVWAHLEGALDKTQMEEQGIIATRQLAKRQLTWLRTWPNIQYVHTFSEILGRISVESDA